MEHSHGHKFNSFLGLDILVGGRSHSPHGNGRRLPKWPPTPADNEIVRELICNECSENI